MAFAAGIAAGDWCGLSIAEAAPLALLAAALALLARRRAGPIGIALLALAFALGLEAQAVRPHAPAELTDGKKRHVEGVVERPPDRAFGITRLLVALSSVREGDDERPARGRVALTVAGEPLEPLGPGDRVRFSAVLREPRGFRNPGAEDAARRAAALGIVAVAGVHEPAALVRLDVDSRPGPLARAWRRLERWRANARTFVAATLPGDGAVLVDALVLGDRGGVDRALDDAFRAAGVSHVLSVSGLHLAIATLLFYGGVAWLLLRVPRLGRGRPVRRWAALAALPAALAYTLMTGAEVATVRACLVAFVWLAGVALGRRATAVEALAIAALIVLAWAPLE